MLFIGNAGNLRDLDPQTVTGVFRRSVSPPPPLTSLLEGLVAHHPSDDRYSGNRALPNAGEVCEEGPGFGLSICARTAPAGAMGIP